MRRAVDGQAFDQWASMRCQTAACRGLFMRRQRRCGATRRRCRRPAPSRRGASPSATAARSSRPRSRCRLRSELNASQPVCVDDAALAPGSCRRSGHLVLCRGPRRSGRASARTGTRHKRCSRPSRAPMARRSLASSPGRTRCRAAGASCRRCALAAPGSDAARVCQGLLS